MDKPRGVRNNNPGNLRWGAPWQGLVPAAQRTDKDFCQFIAPAWGIRAIAVTLITYQDKRRAGDGSRIDSVREIIDRWAPDFENDTDSYTRSVASALGVGPDVETVNVHDYATMRALVRAIIRHENGNAAEFDWHDAAEWYDDVTLDEGLRMAGIVKPAARKVPSPVAVAVTTGGTAAAVEALQQVQPLLQATSQAVNATAGWPQWLRLIGALLVLASLATAGIAWWRQRRALRAVHA
ncbi:hypothetical protein EPN44_16025 [bacterium]|nr:MAG: hypothetical protein EPN44_16025 [bacterium]